ISAPSGTSFNDTGLAAATLYRYRVRAADAAGNLSNYSAIASATTLASGSGGPIARNECASPPPGTIFCSDFESANWRSGWTDSTLSDITDVADLGPSQDAANNM